MPTYEYRCADCGAKFERFETMSEHEPGSATCPECKSKALSQIYHAPLVKTAKKS